MKKEWNLPWTIKHIQIINSLLTFCYRKHLYFLFIKSNILGQIWNEQENKENKIIEHIRTLSVTREPSGISTVISITVGKTTTNKATNSD